MCRPFFIVCVWAVTAPCLLSSPLIRHRDSSLDSTDRVTYVYHGPQIPFGLQSGIASITVPDIFVINDVDVILSIEHTWDSDVSVSLISPAQTSVCIIQNVGSNGDDFTNTYLNDDASFLISNGSPPFTGSFIPSSPLSAFNGESGTGEWQLLLVDDYPATDDGVMIAWTLIIGGRIGSAIQGRVAALESGRPLAGAEISVPGTSYGTVSDALGRFILMVPPDTYVVQCASPGRCAEQTDTLVFVLNDTLTRNFILAQPLFHLPFTSLNLMANSDAVLMNSLMLVNPGDCSLTFETATQTNWLAVLPHEGTIDAGDSLLLRVFISTAGLPPGDYVGSIEFTHNAASGHNAIPVFLCIFPALGMPEASDDWPDDYCLGQLYPNPFNTSTRLTFALPSPADVRIDLYNSIGQRVQTIADACLQAGNHEVLLDGSDLASGVYFLQMTAGEFRGVRRFVLEK